MRAAPEALSARLGYRFSDEALMHSALTHRSVGGRNNERLEFLGDSILNFIIAAELYRRYPGASEGDLSRMRASLVNKDALGRIAADLSLGEFIYLGSGELKSGGFRRKSILADAVEALFGAVYVDGGFEPVEAVVLNLYRPWLDSPIDPEMLKDFKTRLQELLQSRRHVLPVYELVEISGRPHAQTFKIKCVIEAAGHEFIGTGTSRRKAEQEAARQAFEQLTSGKG